MLICLKIWTNQGQPLVIENKRDRFKSAFGFRIRNDEFIKKWTNLSQPLVFETRNVDIS